MLITLIVFFIILSLLVLIHEAGHYFVGKWLGIKVEEFGFGLPPRIWGKKIGETIYSINWLPIGGFVKLYGEDEAGAGRVGDSSKHLKVKDESRAFYARSVWQRALVVVAGVVMNAILAMVIYYAFLGISGFSTELPLLSNYHFFGTEQKNYDLNDSDTVISVISENSPAAHIGMEAPVQILTVDNIAMTNQREKFIDYINHHKGKEVTLVWKEVSTGKVASGKIVPRVHPPENEGPMGVAFFPVAVLSYNTPVQKVFSGVTYPVNLMAYNLDVMAALFRESVKEKNAAPVSQGFSGPVGIYSLVGSILKINNVKERVLQILNLTGLLSVSLAFFNVLPIPALDGGRLFFILIEGIFRKKVSPRIEGVIHTVGMAVLLALILLITFKDIVQIFH